MPAHRKFAADGRIVIEKQKFDGENERGRSLSMPEREPERAVFVAVKVANATRNKVAAHRFRAASFAGMLCAKRTAKPGVRPEKMSKLIFPDCRWFSSARKLSLRRSSFRRRLFVVVFKPVRQDGSRAQAGPGAELEAAEASNVSSCQFLFSSLLIPHKAPCKPFPPAGTAIRCWWACPARR